MTQRESFEKISPYKSEAAFEVWQAAQAALIADIVEKLNNARCKAKDCRPIAHEVHEEAINKAIEIVRKARE